MPDPVQEGLDLEAETETIDHQYDTVAGARWLVIGLGCRRLVLLIVSLILPKYLLPTDYAMVSIAMMIINVVNIVGPQQLVGHALIQRRESGPKVEGTAFLLISAIALLLYLGLFAAAPSIAVFFAEPRLTPMIRVLGLTMPLAAAGAMPDLLFSKKMQFKQKVIPDVCGAAANAAVAAPAAVKGLGAWAMVLGTLAMQLVRNALLIASSPWRPSLQFDRGVAKAFLRYGFFVMTSTAGFVALQSVDKLVLGKGMAGLDPLGYYGLAFGFATIIWSTMHMINIRIMFPSYSRMQDDKDLVRRAYLKTVRFIATFAIPAYVGLFFFGRPFFLALYGTKWEPSMTAFHILCLYGLLQCFVSDPGNIFKALGKPEYLHWITVVTVAMLFGGGYAAVRASSFAGVVFSAVTGADLGSTLLWGINAFAWVMVASAAVPLALSLLLLHKLVKVRPAEVFRSMITPALATLPAAIVEWWGLRWLVATGRLARWNVPLFIPLVIVIYGVCLWLIDRRRTAEMVRIGRQALGSFLTKRGRDARNV